MHSNQSADRFNTFISMLGYVGIIVLLTAFILTLTRTVNLRIVNNMILPEWQEDLGKFVLCMLNMYFVFSITLRIFDRRICLIVLGYVPIWVLSGFIPVSLGLLATSVLPLLYAYLVLRFFRMSTQWFRTAGLLLAVIILAYQWVSGAIKIAYFDLQYQNLSLVTTALLSIDLILVLYYIQRSVRHYEEEVIVDAVGKFWVLPEILRIWQAGCVDRPPIPEEQRVAHIIKQAIRWAYFLFQLSMVLAIGKVNNMLIELIIMLPVFWIGRMILGKCWHSSRLWICNCATFTGFYILTKCSLPLSVSLFASVALCGMFTYLMYFLGAKQERLEELEDRYDNDFTRYGLTVEMARIAYEWKVQGMRRKEQAELHNMSDEQMRYCRNQINRAINAQKS